MSIGLPFGNFDKRKRPIAIDPLMLWLSVPAEISREKNLPIQKEG